MQWFPSLRAKESGGSSGEFIEPTTDGRRTFRILTAISIVLVLANSFVVFPAFWRYVHSLPVCDQAPYSLGFFAVLGVAALIPVIRWGVPRAIGMLRYGQYPLPGTRVYRRTRIERGQKVHLHAYANLCVAVVVITLAGWRLYLFAEFFAGAPHQCLADKPLDQHAAQFHHASKRLSR